MSSNDTVGPDTMSVITAFNRIAVTASERITLSMNQTEMYEHKLSDIRTVLSLLKGDIEANQPGDTGDYFRRELANQLHLTYAIDGITHNNILPVVDSAIILEEATRRELNKSTQRTTAPSIEIDDTILDILTRIAGVH